MCNEHDSLTWMNKITLYRLTYGQTQSINHCLCVHLKISLLHFPILKYLFPPQENK